MHGADNAAALFIFINGVCYQLRAEMYGACAVAQTRDQAALEADGKLVSRKRFRQGKESSSKMIAT